MLYVKLVVAVILGVPDSPSQCRVRDVTNTTAVIHCYPGYNGGQRVSYLVYKAGIIVFISLETIHKNLTELLID